MKKAIFEILALWLVLGGSFGIPYLTVLIAAFFLIKSNAQYLVGYFELSALLAPIVFYLLLTHVVSDRQGFNWGFANLIIAVPAAITLFLGTFHPIAYWIGLAFTILTAYITWLLFPKHGMTRLF